MAGDSNEPAPAGGRLVDDALVRRMVRWLPFAMAGHLLVGVPALLISLIVAYGTYEQARATQRMQQAAAWPFVAYRATNYTAAGEHIVGFSLANNGLGPALLGPVEMRYRGHPVRSAVELLARCCGYRAGGTMQLRSTPVVGAALRPGESIDVMGLPDVPANAALFARLEAERRQVSVRACYCSIFDDCWTVDGPQAKPQEVAACPTDWAVLRDR
jgi:hypothetical protein